MVVKEYIAPEEKSFEYLFTSLNLFQVISKPANFIPNLNPSCIDLLVIHQPNTLAPLCLL